MDATLFERRLQLATERSKFDDLQTVFGLDVGEELLPWTAEDDPAVARLLEMRRRLHEQHVRAENLRSELAVARADREEHDRREAERRRAQEEAQRLAEERRRLEREEEERWEREREAQRQREEQARRREEEAELERLRLEQERLQQQILADQRLAESLRVRECSMCATDIPEAIVFQASCCEHQFCWPCAAVYARTEIGAGRLEPKCPSTEECEGRWRTLDLQAHPAGPGPVRRLLTPLQNATGGEMDEAIAAVSLRKYREQAGDAVWRCPRPNCKGMLEVEAGVAMVHCPFPTCGFAWCNACKCQWHADTTCERFQQWKRDNGKQGEDATTAWIRQNTRQCGRCREAVQKNGGCNCVRCRCGYELCWTCGGPAQGHRLPCGHPLWS
eukprot:tig00001128_g7183.t1